MWLMDRYKILKELGRGGTSVVVLVFDKIDQKQYVIKILKKHHPIISFKVIKRIFQNEITSLFKLQNSRICNIEQAFEDIENFYIVLDYINGDLLTSYIEKDADKCIIIKFMYQVLAILQDVHTCGIYHMDVKPQNIVIKDGCAYLIDFGSSYIVTNGHKVYCATPAYTAKEVLEGMLPDESADVYSFGITFYVVLYRRLPSMNTGNSQLESFLLNCCATNKNQRFQNFKEVKHSLDNFVTSSTVFENNKNQSEREIIYGKARKNNT